MTVEQPKLTIAICTYNRAECLEASVSSCYDQETTIPFNVLIVNNNSTDDTIEVVEKLRSKYPALRLVNEENQGLSHARNRALKESNADVVAYIDDDCVLLPGWIEAIWQGFDDPQVGCVGGATQVGYPNNERPDWIVPSMEGLLGRCYHGTEEKQVDAACGGNMATRRELGLALDGFAISLGYAGKSKLPGEDVDFAKRVIEAGFMVMYLPKAELIHCVDASRLRLDWLRERMRLNGCFYAIVYRDRMSPWKTMVYCLRCIVLRFIWDVLGNRKRSLSYQMERIFAGGELDAMLPGVAGRALRVLIAVTAAPVAITGLLVNSLRGKKPGI